MSMLAETKKKKRWQINPRGTLWSNDENKFGQKILEKMGWSKGKGLGKEEQGCRDPIRVSMNEDNKGVGYKGKGDLDWTKHVDDFEDVLSNLNSMNNADDHVDSLPNEMESLEEKSKTSKSRVHYHKFTRSKDLSTYKDDDLACILGSKRHKSKAPKIEKNAEVGESDQSHGLTTIHGGNLKEYFSQKMTELKRKRGEGIIGCEDPTDQEMNASFPDLEFEPEKMSFSFNVSQSINDGSDCHGHKKKKSKRKNGICTEESLIENETSETKKIKKNKENNLEEMAIEFEQASKPKKCKNKDIVLGDIIIEEEPGRKLKKSRRKSKENLEDVIIGNELEMAPKKKKKSKKNLTLLEENPGVDNEKDGTKNEAKESLEEDCPQLTNEKVKKKQRKDVNVDVLDSGCCTENLEENQSLKIDKKKKKKGKGSSAEVCLEIEDQDIIRENEVDKAREMNESYDIATSEKSRKKRKAKEENQSNNAPLKKIKKLASELNLADLFKSSSSLVPVDDLNDTKKTEKKSKLSAKKSFKELKNGMEATLKRMKNKNCQPDLLENVLEGQEDKENNDQENELKERSESEVLKSAANFFMFSKKGYVDSIPADFDVDALFPGSNLGEIKGYQMKDSF